METPCDRSHPVQCLKSTIFLLVLFMSRLLNYSWSTKAVYSVTIKLYEIKYHLICVLVSGIHYNSFCRLTQIYRYFKSLATISRCFKLFIVMHRKLMDKLTVEHILVNYIQNQIFGQLVYNHQKYYMLQSSGRKQEKASVSRTFQRSFRYSVLRKGYRAISPS